MWRIFPILAVLLLIAFLIPLPPHDRIPSTYKLWDGDIIVKRRLIGPNIEMEIYTRWVKEDRSVWYVVKPLDDHKNEHLQEIHESEIISHWGFSKDNWRSE